MEAKPMTLHTKISYIKSVLRIIGYLVLIAYSDTLLTIGACFLIGAELLGIVEELPGSYKGTDTNG
jgi:hypothetical protein